MDLEYKKNVLYNIIKNAKDVFIFLKHERFKIRRIYPLSLNINIVTCYDYKIQNIIDYDIRSFNIFSLLDIIQEEIYFS